jgi:cytochrome c oxidase subunit II
MKRVAETDAKARALIAKRSETAFGPRGARDLRGKAGSCPSAIVALTGILACSSCPTIALAQDRSAASHGLSYMTAFGPKNYAVVSLLYGTIIISLAVVAIIGILVLAGLLLRGSRIAPAAIATVPVERRGSGLPFVYVAVAVSFLVLLGSAVWNYVVLAKVANPPSSPAVTIHVTGHQWWWEVAYVDKNASRRFTTANEIHIPVGKPVRVELSAADVIHSFWVPALTGKMDTIPGQRNVTWMQADKAGIYRGQCTEYCGQQHAHMGFVVVAQPPQEFESWWNHQLEPPASPTSEAGMRNAAKAQSAFLRNCAVCHTVRGTAANGKVGPDLSHLMQRQTIAAATLPNSTGALSGWISDPQHIKPGNLMPTLDLSAADLNAVRDFLQTLK